MFFLCLLIRLKVRQIDRGRHAIENDLNGLVPHFDEGANHDDMLKLHDSLSI